MGAGTRWLGSFLRSIKLENTGALGPDWWQSLVRLNRCSSGAYIVEPEAKGEGYANYGLMFLKKWWRGRR
jgi:hypothetical protein